MIFLFNKTIMDNVVINEMVKSNSTDQENNSLNSTASLAAIVTLYM